jgi:hypothetical protein
VSLWLIADDYGNLRADPDYVRGQCLWATRESRDGVAKALAGLARVSLVSPYTVRGQSYLHIHGWEKHQKVDHPGKPRMPGPECGDSSTSIDSRNPREDSRESPDSLAPDLRPPTSDQDQRPPTGSDASVARLPGKGKRRKPTDLTAEEESTALRVLERIGSRTGVKYQGSSTHLALIARQLRSGRNEHRLRAIVAYVWDVSGLGWSEKPNMHGYLRPETLFGPEAIERYDAQAMAWLERHFPDEAARARADQEAA